MTGVHQCLYKVNDVLHAGGDLGVYVCVHHVQPVGIGLVLGDILLRHLCGGTALLVGTLDDLVVHVGEILHI